MIRSWKHKGLEVFHKTGSTAGVNASHRSRLKLILQRLEAAVAPKDMNLPGMRFHGLTGKLKDHYSVVVNKNWRVIFKFEGADAILVDYLDYH